MKKVFYLFILIIVSSNIIAQTISTKSVSLENNKVVLVYEVNKPLNIQITTSLFSSIDNFTAALKEVSGNIGKNIKNGENKVIWDFNKEGITLPEDIEFEVKFKTIASKPSSIFKYDKNIFFVPEIFSKQKATTFSWRANDISKEMLIELYLEGEKLLLLDFINNTNEYTWQPASNLDNTDNYQLKLINKSNKNDFILSNSFEIAKKVKEKNSNEQELSRFFYLENKYFTGDIIELIYGKSIVANTYKLSLYKNEVFDRLINITNQSENKWQIPPALEKDVYYIKIEDKNKASEYIRSNSFEIYPKKKKKEKKKETEEFTIVKINEEYSHGEKVMVVFDEELKSKEIIIKLYQNEKELKTLDILKNKGYYKWEIPKIEKKGKKYQIRIEDKSDPNLFIMTSEFKISK